jgi:hypothetical protein
MTDQLKPCPMCGSTAKLDSTGASESYGYAWQTLFIECNDNHNRKCNMGVSLEADFCMLPRRDHKKLLTTLWNKLGETE